MFLIAVVDMDLMRNSSRYKTADIDSRIRSHFHSLSPDTYSFFLSFFLHFFPSFSLPLFISFFLSFFLYFFLYIFSFPFSFSFSLFPLFLVLLLYCFVFFLSLYSSLLLLLQIWHLPFLTLTICWTRFDSTRQQSNTVLRIDPFCLFWSVIIISPPPSINCQVNFPSLVWGSEFGRVDTKEGGN